MPNFSYTGDPKSIKPEAPHVYIINGHCKARIMGPKHLQSAAVCFFRERPGCMLDAILLLTKTRLLQVFTMMVPV